MSNGNMFTRSKQPSSCNMQTPIQPWLPIGLGPHLFVKVPQLGESEVTFAVFESSCRLLLPAL